jgi:hypothetical protein
VQRQHAVLVLEFGDERHLIHLAHLRTTSTPLLKC